MQIVDTTKFVIGIVFFLIGAGVLVYTRGERGFGQTRQAGVMFLLASAAFVAIGLGKLSF
jgi:hypothetical protein